MNANDRLTNQQKRTIDQETDSGPPGGNNMPASEYVNPDVQARDSSSWHGQQSATALQEKAQLDQDLATVKDQAAKFDGGIASDTT